MRPQFPALLAVRTEPELKAALCAVAEHEKTNVAELVRRESRLMALAFPERAQIYKAQARFWIAMARKARPPPLP